MLQPPDPVLPFRPSPLSEWMCSSSPSSKSTAIGAVTSPSSVKTLPMVATLGDCRVCLPLPPPPAAVPAKRRGESLVEKSGCWEVDRPTKGEREFSDEVALSEGDGGPP